MDVANDRLVHQLEIELRVVERGRNRARRHHVAGVAVSREPERHHANPCNA
jgi:hypothetical protein